jgi:hypothetical protein
MAKAQLVTRATASGTNTENLNKGSALTHAEMDKNLIGLRDASFGIADDSSTVLSVTNDKTITVAGGTGITTALSGDTLTITAAGSGDITSVVAGDGLTGGATTGDATLNIGAGTGIDVAADAIAVDVSDFMANGSNNRVVTATGTDAMNAEANMTFDGSTLAVTGNMTASTTIGATTDITAGGSITAGTSIGNDAITIDDNTIKTSRSNDNLILDTNGTGFINTGNDIVDVFSTNTRWRNGVTRIYNEPSDFDFSAQDSSGERKYTHLTLTRVKSNGTDSSSSHNRWRNAYNVLDIDVNGALLTGPRPDLMSALTAEVQVQNSAGSSNTGKLANVASLFTNVYAFGNSSQLDIDNMLGIESRNFSESESGQTINITNSIGFQFRGTAHDGSGTHNTTNEICVDYQAGEATNKIFLQTDTDTALSNVGTLNKYRESINALTNSSTITVDCSLAPVHTVTIAQATGFNFKNLGTGQTATVVVKQDGSGNHTATFTEEDSTAIKFQGGAPTLSTGANAIDVITVFNTGSEVLGNCAKAYA